MLNTADGLVAQCGKIPKVDDWNSSNFVILLTDNAAVRATHEDSADGQYVPDTASVDHMFKSDDSGIDDSNHTLGYWTIVGSFVFFWHRLNLLLESCC